MYYILYVCKYFISYTQLCIVFGPRLLQWIKTSNLIKIPILLYLDATFFYRENNKLLRNFSHKLIYLYWSLNVEINCETWELPTPAFLSYFKNAQSLILLTQYLIIMRELWKKKIIIILINTICSVIFTLY
jgi:hypothetical protein